MTWINRSKIGGLNAAGMSWFMTHRGDGILYTTLRRRDAPPAGVLCPANVRDFNVIVIRSSFGIAVALIEYQERVAPIHYKHYKREEKMKTKPILRAVIFGGGMALLANPAWADGGSYSHDRNQAGQERSHGSGVTSRGMEQSPSEAHALGQEKTREVQQALQQKGFEAGNDGIMDSKTKDAIAKFQRENNLPATGTVDEKTAEKLGVEMSSSKQWRSNEPRIQPEPRSSEGQFMGQGQSGARGEHGSTIPSPNQPQSPTQPR